MFYTSQVVQDFLHQQYPTLGKRWKSSKSDISGSGSSQEGTHCQKMSKGYVCKSLAKKNKWLAAPMRVSNRMLHRPTSGFGHADKTGHFSVILTYPEITSTYSHQITLPT